LEDSRSAPPDLDTVPDQAESSGWMAAFHALSVQLGPLNQYRLVWDPYDSPTDAEVTGVLADDLMDIHRDLRRGLACWTAGVSGEALWEWRFGFDTHWGHHAVCALAALYAQCAWHDAAWPGFPDHAA
jgi:hypothetical protein